MHFIVGLEFCMRYGDSDKNIENHHLSVSTSLISLLCLKEEEEHTSVQTHKKKYPKNPTSNINQIKMKKEDVSLHT